MRLLLAAVGRAKAGPERALFEHYAARLSWPLTLKEVEEKRPLPAAERMAREAELLLAAVPPGAIVVALDERGRQTPSEEFAARLGAWRDSGRSDICFLIGGADGHSEAVRKRADLLLAFGAMTWPHMLVRGMLAEQLYRAQCILAGHPYHRS
jgi:23S rRNA (pseudouridine1915-N3)-methyltransferase